MVFGRDPVILIYLLSQVSTPISLYHTYKCLMCICMSLSCLFCFTASPVCCPSLVSTVKESESEVAQSCPTLCNPMDCSLPGSSVHGIFQAIVLEWIAISFSRGSSWPRDWTRVSRIVDRCFTIWATREVCTIMFYFHGWVVRLNIWFGKA